MIIALAHVRTSHKQLADLIGVVGPTQLAVQVGQITAKWPDRAAVLVDAILAGPDTELPLQAAVETPVVNVEIINHNHIPEGKQGATGARGDKGDTVVGPVGPPGMPGQTIAGPPGKDGDPGQHGTDGRPGQDAQIPEVKVTVTKDPPVSATVHHGDGSVSRIEVD